MNKRTKNKNAAARECITEPSPLHTGVPHEIKQVLYDKAGTAQLQNHHEVANQQGQN